jgi:hypothetical protein
MRLFRSNDLNHKFGWLIRVDSGGFFMSFLIDFFFIFIIQYQIDWELNFIVYFNFFSCGYPSLMTRI